MKALHLMFTVVAFSLTACNESRRGNDSNVNETRNEAAAEANTDKFQGETQRDAEFTYERVSSYYGDIKLAELANQRSRNPQAMELAQTIVTDHTAALNELKKIAQARAISIPVEEDNDLERKIERLASNSTEEFDKEWTDEMLSRHQDAIGKFEKRFEATGDTTLKSYIEKTLPVLKKHKGRLESLKEKLKEHT